MPEITNEPWSWILVGLAAYMAVSFGLMYFAGFFYGDRAEEKVEMTIARPIWIVWAVLVAVKNSLVWVVTHPFRARFRGQFYEVFHTYPLVYRTSQYADENIAKVDKELTKRAVAFNSAIADQEGLRTFPTGKEQDLVRVELEVASAKEAFWNAHGLAEKAGYSVRETFREYLPQPSVPPPPTRGPVGVELTRGYATGWPSQR